MDDDVFSFQWHLTDRCPGGCAHCYQERHDGRSELPAGQFWRLCDNLFDGLAGRPFTVNLTGGEPLLFERLPRLLQLLQRQDNLRQVDIITSGRVLDTGLLAELAGHECLHGFKLSLESASPRINDAIRGAGAFAATCRALEVIGRTTDRPVVLMVTLSTLNLQDLAGLVELARRLGAAGLICERFVPLGRGRRLAGSVLGPRQWLQVVRSVLQLAGLDEDPLRLLGYHAFWLEFDGQEVAGLRAASCNLGPNSMALMPDGRVFPCRRLPLEVGNLCRQPLAEILRQLEGFQPHRLRRRLHGRLCASCSLDDCAGCRALARSAGDWLGDDPRCILWLEREAEG